MKSFYLDYHHLITLCLITLCILLSDDIQAAATTTTMMITTKRPVQEYSREVLRLAKAAHIKAYMNENTPPCENFYKFSCGNWKRLHPAIATGSKTTYLEQQHELFIHKCADALKNRNENDNNAETLIKNFYESCRAEAMDFKTGFDVIRNIMDFKGGWPELQDPIWYTNEFDWLKTVADLKLKLGVDVLIGLEVIPDYSEKNMHRIRLNAPKFELGRTGRNGTISRKLRAKFKYRVSQKLRSYFPNMSDTWAEEVADQVVDVERELADGLTEDPNLTLRQITRISTAHEITKKYERYLNINRYLELVFNETVYTEIYVAHQDYMFAVFSLIHSTPKLTIANYTMWRVLDHFDAMQMPIHEKPDIWCVQRIAEYFPHQLDGLFFTNFNGQQMIDESLHLWRVIKETFSNALEYSHEYRWMSHESRQHSINKLKDMGVEIFSPDKYDLIKNLSDLSIQPNNYYENLLNILQWQSKKYLMKIIQSPSQNETGFKKLTYQVKKNSIALPFNYLNKYFFWDSSYPMAFKYATLGYLYAKEMLRGFDKIGRSYYLDKKNSLWDRKSIDMFNERVKCLEEQYSAFHQFNNKQVRDEDLRGKTISDNGALSIAYRAYIQWVDNNESIKNHVLLNETLPLLNYNPHQLFFIGYAQLWCSDYPESIKIYEELPEMLRVNAAVSNSKAFAEKFKCEVDDKLNSPKKCKVFV